MVEEIVAGQMLDVSFMLECEVATSAITQKNILKTALYTFVNPMLIGGALADVHSSDDVYKSLGLTLGQAFQIQDDMLDVVGDTHKTGKMTFSDVQAGQHTLLTQYIFQSKEPKDKEILLSLFGKDIDENARKVLARLFHETGALDHAESQIDALFTRAKKIISDSKTKPEAKQTWQNFITLLDKRKS